MFFFSFSFDFADVRIEHSSILIGISGNCFEKRRKIPSKDGQMRCILMKPRKSLHLTNPIDVYTYQFRFVDILRVENGCVHVSCVSVCIRIEPNIHFNLLMTLKFMAWISVMRTTPLYQLINIFCGSMAFCVSFLIDAQP